MSDKLYNKLFSRNIGILSKKDQEILRKTKVAIAGAGADGGITAERICRLGVGEINIADFDKFDITNINRQFESSLKSINKNKAKVIGTKLRNLNPNVKINIFYKGLNKKNLTKFLDNADIIVDEIDFKKYDLSVALQNVARKKGIFVIMGISVGFGANLFIFDPRGLSLEKYIGNKFSLKKFCPFMPKYISREEFQKVSSGKKEAPVISPAVSLTASMITAEILKIILKKKKPVVMPKFTWLDLLENKLEIRKVRI